MQYKSLGSTGVKVSPLCFGTWTFGWGADEGTSKELFFRCREAGINFFDCANVYSHGTAEEILGDLIADCRDEVVVTSKFSGVMGDDPNARGASRYHIRQAVEASLRRLSTDHIDVYFIHHFQEDIPLEDVLRTLDDLVSAGKILYIGASNFAAWQVTKCLGISAARGWAHIDVIQPMYNLVKRQAEVEILPMALSENLGVIPYSPLGGGLLTGKYTADKEAVGRITTVPMYKTRYGEDWMWKSAQEFSRFARAAGFDPPALAAAWVASHPAVTAPIIGARNVKQLESTLKALDIVMTPAFRAEISALSPQPPPAHDRNDER